LEEEVVVVVEELIYDRKKNPAASICARGMLDGEPALYCAVLIRTPLRIQI